MSDQLRPISAELRPYIDRVDEESVNRVGERLHQSKPVPRAGFRADLRASLAERPQGLAPLTFGRPRRLGLAIGCYSGSGLLLIAVAAAGVLGVGPLSA